MTNRQPEAHVSCIGRQARPLAGSVRQSERSCNPQRMGEARPRHYPFPSEVPSDGIILIPQAIDSRLGGRTLVLLALSENL